jgi:hypothetical protein
MLKKPFPSATTPVGRKCSCPHGWKCEQGSSIAKLAPKSIKKKDVIQHQMAITQCEFFDDEKKGNADQKMLTKQKWLSSKYRCCCGKQGAWSDSKCLPLHSSDVIKEGSPVFGNRESGVLIEGTDRVLDYGKKVRASGAVTNGKVPIEGGGEVSLATVIVGAELESFTSGKVETYVPVRSQTFQNKHMPCQKAGNFGKSYNRGWTSKHHFVSDGCCLATQPRVHVERYACGQYYNPSCECMQTKYCTRRHHWTACSSWENLYHCRGAMAEQTGQLALRVDPSPGLCIGDRSTVESLGQQYGLEAVPNNVKNFALRYDAKKARQGQCPVHWSPFRHYKNVQNTANTMGPMPNLKFFCSCDHACQLSE